MSQNELSNYHEIEFIRPFFINLSLHLILIIEKLLLALVTLPISKPNPVVCWTAENKIPRCEQVCKENKRDQFIKEKL